MKNNRLQLTIKNAKWTAIFSIIILLVNFFSRSVFINHLGTSIVGLTATIASIIGFLNLAELGVGAAMTQALYKPIYDDDQNRIREIIALLGFFGKLIGAVILIAGLIITPFLPNMLTIDDGVGLTQIYLTFGAIMFTTILSYWANYKQFMVVAAGRSYAITIIQNTVLVLKLIAQMGCLILLDMGLGSFLACEMIFAIAFAVILETYTRKNYPWLKTSWRNATKYWREEKKILQNIRRIFSSKIGSTILLQSDNIVIQIIMGFKEVTYFTNYTMLMGRIVQIIASMMGNSHAAVGELICSDDKKKINLVHGQYTALFVLLGGVVAFGFYMLVNPFIDLWLNNQTIYNDTIVLLLSFNLFVAVYRRANDIFLNGFGLFNDVWASWSEAIINLIISVVLTINYGIIGVIIGTTVATTLNALAWKPYYLNSKGLKQNLGKFYLHLIALIAMVAVSWVATMAINNLIELPSGWLGLIIRGVTTVGIYTLLSLGLMAIISPAIRSLFIVAKNWLKK